MTTVDDALLAATTYLAVHNTDRAIDTLTSALQENPQNAALLTALARAHLIAKTPHAAARAAYSALAITPDDTDAMRVYALALSDLGDRGAAMNVAYRAVLAAPNDYLTHHTYAIVLTEARQYPAALFVVCEALRLQPASANAHFQHGMILGKLGRFSESDAAYAETLRLSPEHSVAMHNLAFNKLQRGSWRAALGGFLGAARLDPELGNLVRTNLGATMRTPLRWTTLAAVLVCYLAITSIASAAHGDGLGYRVGCGLSVLALIVLLGWVIREARVIPRSARWALLRSKPMLGLRFVVALAAIAVVTPVCLGAQSPMLVLLAGGLAFFALLITVIGWKAGT